MCLIQLSVQHYIKTDFYTIGDFYPLLRKTHETRMLALVGSGEYLPKMEPVDRFLLEHLKDNPIVVCLPTAAGQEGDERISYWNNLGVHYFQRLGASVSALPVIDKFSANEAKYAEKISNANFIYLSGGKPGYLFDTLVNSLVWKAISDVHAKGGVLAGCSAGAMIMGENFYSYTGMRSGFGFLRRMTVMPHFNEIPEERIEAMCHRLDKHLNLIGIEANTALICTQASYHVMGSGGVCFFDHVTSTRFTQGVLPPSLFESG